MEALDAPVGGMFNDCLHLYPVAAAFAVQHALEGVAEAAVAGHRHAGTRRNTLLDGIPVRLGNQRFMTAFDLQIFFLLALALVQLPVTDFLFLAVVAPLDVAAVERAFQQAQDVSGCP